MKRYVDSDAYDVLIIDCAPTAETLRLLSLPEVMNWYIERIFPVERRVVKTIRPLLTKLTSMPIADDRIFAAIERLHRNLDGVRRILTNEKVSSVRLVVNPEAMVIAEARRTYTYLSLFGYRVDAVVANRIIPDTVTDPYFGKWKEIQQKHLATIHESFEPVPDPDRAAVRPRDGRRREPRARWATRSTATWSPPTSSTRTSRSRSSKRGPQYLLSLRLPFTEKAEIDIHRKADELYIRVGPYKRNLILPQTLQRLDVQGAQMIEDRLQITFGKAPAKPAAPPADSDERNSPWPRTHHEAPVDDRPEEAGPAGHDPACARSRSARSRMLLTATGTVRPEVVEHLLAAGRELLLAAQVVINARAEGLERRSPLEKIEIG